MREAGRDRGREGTKERERRRAYVTVSPANLYVTLIVTRSSRSNVAFPLPFPLAALEGGATEDEVGLETTGFEVEAEVGAEVDAA